MGLFGLFGKKKKEDQEALAATKLIAAMMQFHQETSKDGVDSDDIPKGYGPYGLCKTNPIPTSSILGSNAYISRLRTKDGRPIESSRIGSTTAEDVTNGPIDMYRITSDGVSLGTVYICPYHKRNSGKAPEGFRLV